MKMVRLLISKKHKNFLDIYQDTGKTPRSLIEYYTAQDFSMSFF